MPDAAGSSLPAVRLRPVTRADVPVLHAHQLDPESNRLAGTKPRDLPSFQATWEKIFADATVVSRVVISGDTVVGGISRFKAEGVDAVGYWIARPHWGKGIASEALRLFLLEVSTRPLHAIIARHNAASARVLEKSGFRLTGYKMGEETDRYTAGELALYVLE